MELAATTRRARRVAPVIVTIWLILAALTWLVMLGFTNFVVWGDPPEAILIGVIVAAALCALFWPFAWLVGAKVLYDAVMHR
jgi:hypothetical protein